MSKADLDRFNNFMVEYKEEIKAEYKKLLQKKDKEIERLNNIIENLEEELMTIYLDILEYNEDYAKREIKKLKGVNKE